jgi:glutathione S-transferase
MVQLEVYGDPHAMCTQKILILLEELNLKYDLKSVDLSKGEQKSEEFLKLNPFGKIPAVKYGSRDLFESRSILRYIAKNNVEIEDLLGDIEVDIWLESEGQNYNPLVSKIIYEKVFKKLYNNDEKPNEELVEKLLKELEDILDIYESRLKNVSYIGGDKFSIADISHIPYTNYMLRIGYKEMYKSRPNVYKWLKRIMKRDSVKYVLSKNEL